jgi:hypothetical protein
MTDSGDLRSLRGLQLCPLCPDLQAYYWTPTDLASHIRSEHQSHDHDPTLSAEQLTLLYPLSVRDCPQCHRCYSLTRSYDSHVRMCVGNSGSPVAGKKRKSNDHIEDNGGDQLAMSQINPSTNSAKRQRLPDQPHQDLSSSDTSDTSESTIPPSWLNTHTDDEPASGIASSSSFCNTNN